MGDLASETLQTAVGTQTEYKLPSIYEVLAQENLKNSVRPAFEYLVKVLASHQPERFGWALTWFDEVFTLVEAIVQHHFLLAHVASYAEKYYGLRRKIKGLKIESHSYLGSRLHWLSLATLTLAPYIEVKLKKAYESVVDKNEELGESLHMNLHSKLIFWFYPFIHTIWQTMKLYYQFMFVIRQNKYPDPLLRLLKIKLVVENPQAESNTSPNPLSQVLTKMISGGVHAGVFVLRFIEWWYSEDSQTTVNQITETPVPDPPSDNTKSRLLPVNDKVTCPLCKRLRRNDTTLSTSGYVFCYVCIYKYVKSNSRCPVTGYPTDIEHLIKLYIAG